MERSRVRIKLICKNQDCPRPPREFEVHYSLRRQEYCCRACFQIAYALKLAATAKANPCITAERFDELTQTLKMSESLRACARLVLVEGWLNKNVVASTSFCQQEISKAVARYRKAANIA